MGLMDDIFKMQPPEGFGDLNDAMKQFREQIWKQFRIPPDEFKNDPSAGFRSTFSTGQTYGPIHPNSRCEPIFGNWSTEGPEPVISQEEMDKAIKEMERIAHEQAQRAYSYGFQANRPPTADPSWSPEAENFNTVMNKNGVEVQVKPGTQTAPVPADLEAIRSDPDSDFEITLPVWKSARARGARKD